MRFVIAIVAIFVSAFGAVATFVDRSVDWVDRLDTSNTSSIIATSTLPIALEPSESVASKKERSQVFVLTPTPITTPNLEVVTKTPPPSPAPAPVVKKAKVASLAPIPPSTQGIVPRDTGVINEKAVFDLTNVERVREGGGVLLWNQHLASMAYTKAKDMLDRQYFAHESPDGKNVAGLAVDASYAYRLVGENLAVGNFRSNEELIQGWMGSPGHRENMLKGEYTEMGAATLEGVFEGARVWMAVQEFGKPSPICDAPSIETKEDIVAMNKKLSGLEEGIAIAKSAIESSIGEERNQKIADYNALVDVYNSLVPVIKSLVSDYNDDVRAYNTCTSAP